MKLPITQFGEGDGVPIVLVHGLFGQGRNLAGIARSLEQALKRAFEKAQGQLRPVFTVDLRNHGSAPWDDHHDYLAMANDLYESFAEYEKIDVMGHSMGGKAAMVLALQHPDFVNRLAVADIAPVSYTHDHIELIDAMLGLDLSTLQSRRDADEKLAPSITDQGTRAFLLHSLALGENPHWRNNLAVLKKNMSHIIAWPEIYGSFVNSTIFIGGQNSDYITDQYRQQINAYFPNARISMIKDTGHWLHAEKPDVFISLLKHFFSV